MYRRCRHCLVETCLRWVGRALQCATTNLSRQKVQNQLTKPDARCRTQLIMSDCAAVGIHFSDLELLYRNLKQRTESHLFNYILHASSTADKAFNNVKKLCMSIRFDTVSAFLCLPIIWLQCLVIKQCFNYFSVSSSQFYTYIQS